MLTKKQLFTRGMLDISPHMLSVIPFGIICGAIGVELGFHPYLVYAQFDCSHIHFCFVTIKNLVGIAE